MKKIILTIVSIAISISVFAQGKSEFKYFSLKAGVTHGLFTKQPGKFDYRFLETPGGSMKMESSPSYFDYVPGYYAGVIYNYDFRNENVGLVLGAEFTNYGMGVRFQSQDDKYSLIQKHSVSAISAPVYIKLGKRYYDKQNYFYLGFRYQYNLIHNLKEEVNWTSKSTTQDLGKDMLAKQNFGVMTGFNYLFFNLEVSYMFGGFLNKDYSQFLYGNKMPVKPYESFGGGNLFVSTGFNIPFNSWSSRQVYLFNMWFKRVFK